MMYKELKVQILNWLVENETTWNRLNECIKAFRAYVYDADGNYLIGGEDVANFIEHAEKLLYSN